MRNSLNLNSAPSLKGSAGGKFSLRPAFQLSPFSVTSRNTGAGFNRGGGIVSGNESRALCTFLLKGPSIQQQRFMLIRRKTREKPALWRAYLFSGRLSFSVREQKSADEGGSRRRHHCVRDGGREEDRPFYTMEFAITFLLGNTLKNIRFQTTVQRARN